MYNFALHNLREEEFPNLNDATYVDHAGTTLFSKSQMDAIHKDLTSNLYGNPHSHHYSSKLTTDSVDQMRYRLLRFFNASPEEYSLIFTSGCTAGLKMVADNFNFKYEDDDTSENQPRGTFCFLQDNHTSVQGMRGQLMTSGVDCVCLDDGELEAAMARAVHTTTTTTTSPPPSTTTIKSQPQLPPTSTTSSLLVYPAQSNFSGQRYPLSWIDRVHTHGLSLGQPDPFPSSWYVLLDAASFVSTSPLPLDRIKPDFVTVSFYKIFGYPTGVGAILVHHRAAHLLAKRYFGGGTVAASTAKDPFQVFRKSLHERFEDGTLPFLSIVSLRHGLDSVKTLGGGMEAVSKHVFCVAAYFHQHLTRLQHGNGQPLAGVYGDVRFQSPADQGGIVTFNLQRSDGRFIGYAEVDKFAQLHDVHLRTGCFCNTGACQKYLAISSQTIRDNFDAGHVCGDNVDLIGGRPTGAVRVSFGYMSTVDDARTCLRFIMDSFLEDVSPMPRLPYPQWWCDAGGQGDVGLVKGQGDVGSAKGQGDVGWVKGQGDVGSVKGQGDVGSVKGQGDVVGVPVIPPPTTPGDVVGRLVTDIFLYPIKSCGAFRVTEWQMGTRGLLYDRSWVLVTDSGVTLGQRREPKMCLLTPVVDLTSRTLTLTFPGQNPFHLSLDRGEGTLETTTSVCNNKVCGDRVNTLDCGDAVADWLSCALLRPGVRLLRQLSEDARTSRQTDKGAEGPADGQRLSLANESQMLLLNRASVRALQSKMAEMGNHDDCQDSAMPTVPMDVSEDNMVMRFRGNLVVDGGQPFEEEEWTSIGVGDHTVVCQNVCSRCSMICMDQARGYRSREPLRTLAAWRGKKVPFGVHSRMLSLPDGSRQVIRVGDPVTV